MARNSLPNRILISRSKLALAITAQMFAASTSLGAPTGGEIVGGSASIEQQETETTIVQKTDRLAIDWQSFDVAKNERVEFIQPGQSAVALNRILGNKGSEILGRIDANGHVILVNPRGVVFGENANVNAGGLIASGLQINPEDFMNGELVFKRIEGTDGTVINSGMINAAAGGNVALLGARVENRGLISANLGTVTLASGKEAVLTFDESGLLGVRIDQAILQNELGEAPAVKNSGEIHAENGRVLLSAAATRDVFSQAVNWGEQKQARSVIYSEDGSFTLGAGADVENFGTVNASGERGAGSVVVLAENITHTGAIQVNAQQGKAGHVELHSNTTTIISESGTVSANAEQGGDIKLLGKNVGLLDKAAVAATGVVGGGTVLVGGDKEGLNPQVANADFIYISEAASVDVSATSSGDGGTAVIYAGDTARIYGALAARGGKLSGDGGFVETSGKRGFEIDGAPDVAAQKGTAGHWLIDPQNIEIDRFGTREVVEQGNEFTANGNSARLNANDLRDALNSGATVTVKTGSGSSGEGNILVFEQINLTANVTSTLNLIAHNDIQINANITSFVNGAKNPDRKLNVNLNANTAGADGSITFGNNVRIETSGGNFVVGRVSESGVDSTAPGAYNVDFTNVVIDVTGPSYTAAQINNYFSGRNVATSDYQYLSGSGRILVNASNNVNLGGTNGSGAQYGAVTMHVRGRESGENAEKIHIIAGNDIVLGNGRVWTFDNNATEVLQTGQNPYDGYTTLKLEAGGDIDLNGNISFAYDQPSGDSRQDQTDRLMIDLSADGDISIDGNINTTGGDFLVRNADDLDFAGQSINTASRYGAGDVSINVSGDIFLGSLPMLHSGSTVRTTDIRTPSLTAVAGNRLTLSDDLYTKGGDLTLGAAEWVFNGHSLVTTESERFESKGDITIITAGDLNLPAIQAAGDLVLRSRELSRAFSITNPIDDNRRIQLAGSLIFDIGAGSASLNNIRTAPTGNQAADFITDIEVSSARDINLEVDNRIRLGDLSMTGNLALDSDLDIVQQENSSVQIGGTATLLVNSSDVVLDGAANLFGGSVFIGGSNNTSARNATLAASESVVLGADGREMVLTGNLAVSSGDDLTQVGALSVEGATDLSAAGNIILSASANRLSSLAIGGAQSAEIRNAQDLQLAEVRDTSQLTLSVAGGLTQTDVLNADQLTLDISGATSLTQSENRIGELSGAISGGEINSSASIRLGNFATDNPATINAPEVDIAGQIQLSNDADLVFSNVSIFALSGALQGQGSVTVNGGADNGVYAVSDTALWDAIVLSINGGGGVDTLQGPNLQATWSIIETDMHTLSTAEQGGLTFTGMETLSGGSQADTFSFTSSATTDLSLVGGEGNDVADYSVITENITILLGVDQGINGVELIRGNNTGAASFNSRLEAQGDTEIVWLVNAINAGEVSLNNSQTMAFEGFNQLQGGAAEDQFILQADLIGGAAQIDGSAGDDEFEIDSNLSAELFGGEGDDLFKFNADTLGGVFGGMGDDVIILTASARVADLDGGAGLNRLEGFDADLLWSISAGVDSSGEVAVGVAGEDGTVYVQQARNFAGLKGGTGNDSFLFNSANSGVGVDGGGGVNTADFSLVDEDHTVSLGALAERGISNVAEVVGNASNGIVSTLEIVSIDGGVWTFESGSSGTVVVGDEEISFSQFNDFLGGDGDDSFLIYVSPDGPINGRGGDDIFTLLGPAVVATLVGGDGQDTLEAYQQVENDWVLGSPTSLLQDAANSASIQFSGMETLRGAENYADNFTILDSLEFQPTVVAGDGAATDTIDYSSLLSRSITVTLGDAGLTGFESVIGNGNQTLAGADVDSTWEITADGGSVFWSAQRTTFSGFGYWVGGSENDTFNVRTIGPGAPIGIDGGGGTDQLDLSTLENEVHISLGDASGQLDVANIEDLSANSLYANRLTSSAAQANWTINGANAGTLEENESTSISFSGFHHLNGTHSNIFTLTSSGVLGGETTVGSIAGDGEIGTLRVTGEDSHSWRFDAGVGTGSLWREGTQVLSYSALTNFQGGQGADEFVITDAGASIASIDAGDGDNSLRADFQRNDPLEWSMRDGLGDIAGMVGEFRQISQLYGQTGADVFDIGGATQLELIDSRAGSDEIRLTDDSRVELILAGAGADVVAISNRASVAEPIDGGDGNDTLDLTDYGRAVIWNAVEQRIGDFDYLNIENFRAPASEDLRNTFQAPDGNNRWRITGRDSGELTTEDGQVVTYQAIANLLGGSMDDLFELTAAGSVTGAIDGGAGSNRLQGDDADSEWTLSGLDTGGLGERVASFTRIGNLTGGSGADRFNIEEDGVLSGVLQGGDGAGVDTLTSVRQQQTWTLSGSAPGTIVGADDEIVVAFTGVEALQGSGNGDRLLGSELDTTWTLDGPGAGGVVAEGVNLTFTNFARILGGAGADDFTITTEGAFEGPIDGGGGINSLVIDRTDDLVVSLDPELNLDDAIYALRIQSVEARNQASNRLYGARVNAAGYDWSITGENSGFVNPAGIDGESISFANFSNLFGGERSDSFSVAAEGSLQGVDGGLGDDFLDYSAREDNLEITIGSLGQDADFTIANIEGLVGNDDGSGQNSWRATLIASGGNNTWTLSEGDGIGQDGINDGVFVQEGGVRMVFRNFGHLRGGSGNDEFLLQGQGMLTGSIVDTSGDNRLDLRGVDPARELQVQLFTANAMPNAATETLRIRGIQTLIGAGPATTLIGADRSNQWEINGNDSGRVNYDGNAVSFSRFGHLQGGSGEDTFSAGPAGRLTGWLAGGAGNDAIRFETPQALAVWLADEDGDGPQSGEWWRVRRDIENLDAIRRNPLNRLRLESANATNWRLTGANEGFVAATGFRGFGHLDGGAGDDQFVFSDGGRLSGLLDGGTGTNAVDLTALTDAVTVAQGIRDNVDLRVANLQQLDANPDTSSTNRLWAADQANQWSISASDAGDIGNGFSFSGFGNLRGGSADDHFTFSSMGELSGQIDGGAHQQGDSADYASLTTTLTIDLRAIPDLHNIEQLSGNGEMSLQGPDLQSQWRLQGGINQGSLAYGIDQQLSFSGINNLLGGNQVDSFNFSEGALITKGVHGGDGADQFFVAPGTGTRNQATWLAGGGGNDQLEFIGGGTGWTGSYGPNADGAPMFAFTAPDAETPGTRIGYSGMESVLVRSELERMTLTGSVDADTYRMGSQSWQWGSLIPVIYRDLLQSIRVVGDDTDRVLFAGQVNLSGELHLQGGSVAMEGDGSVAARNLVLEGMQSAGTAEQVLNISVDGLQLLNNAGDVYLLEADDLTIEGVTAESAVSVHLLNGDLRQSGAVEANGSLTLIAQNGAVLLDRDDNLLAGLVTVDAADDAVLHNSGDTELGAVNARHLSVVSAGAIRSDAILAVENSTSFNSGGAIELTAADNDFDQLSIQAAEEVRLVNGDALTITGADVAGHLQLTASSLTIRGPVTTATLEAQASADMVISAGIDTAGDVALENGGTFLMVDQGRIESAEGNILVTSSGAQGLSGLSARQGEVHLDSGAAIVDLNGSALNISAQKFVGRAIEGIGLPADPLELEVAGIDLVNERNSIVLANQGPLTIERIHNGGDITLSNNTDVTFIKESVNAFFGTEEPQYPPDGQKEAPSYGGDFSLSLVSGNIKTDGSLVITQPHIAANSVTITNPHGVFLPPSPVIYAPKEIVITSGRSRNRPPWGFNITPDKITDDTKYYGDVVGAGEQLIEVESLADIDPAIFTPVKNYVYQDVSIRLPSDQLYEDEER